MSTDYNRSILGACCVCLSKALDLLKLTSRQDSSTKTWIHKLRNCVTQIDWSKDYLICLPCTERLNIVYNFHQVCCHSDELRKKILAETGSCEVKAERINEHHEEQKCYDNNSDYCLDDDSSELPDDMLPELTDCKEDSVEFENETDLEEHRNKIHMKEEQSDDEIITKDSSEEQLFPIKKHRRRNGNTNSNIGSKKRLKNSENYTYKGRRKLTKLDNQTHATIIEDENNGENGDVKHVVEENDKSLQHFNLSNDRGPSDDSDAVSDMKFPSIEKTDARDNSDIPKLTFECIVCKNMFNKCTKLIKHALAEHGMEKSEVKPYACTDCPKRYNDSARWKEHYLKYHKSLQNEMCIYCSKTFSSKRALNIHEKRHQNKREYQCPFCPKRFNTISGRLTHKFTVHTDPSKWKYVCNLCNKRFYTRSKLDTHIRRHNNDKPYGCHLCDKKFCDSSELQMHLPSHTNVRDFKCSQCDKEYKREKNLKMHMAKDHNVDNGIKVYVKKKNHCCHICPKAFYTKEKLMRHLCSHTGEKPFPCSVCDKRFTDKWYATQHMKTVHDFVQDTDY